MRGNSNRYTNAHATKDGQCGPQAPAEGLRMTAKREHFRGRDWSKNSPGAGAGEGPEGKLTAPEAGGDGGRGLRRE